ncbi:MAG TPA: HlyD family efflux transporter periplasmic adaptor subunit [Caldithrix abyssi]|uniref:HlyD family efflux transporter periplasmic adaptor subunit n=1 Tax=Caldithrix abyssi TaxID=187145 RepID=A0A7V5RNR4_CALAY|nr:HlyD family efflux transporter periplasmic adaptor subunit [Caldithrix abyssi]
MKYPILFIMIILWSCTDHTPRQTENPPSSPRLQRVDIIHQTLPVTVAVHGYVTYLNDSTMSSPVDARPISISVNKGERVHRGYQLLAYWPKEMGYDYTPRELRAPFNGIVMDIFTKVGQPVKAGEDLIRILEDQYLTMKTTVNPRLRKIFKSDLQASLHIGEHRLPGFVRYLQRWSQSAELLFKNPERLAPPPGLTRAEVFLGRRGGSFIPEDYFKTSDTLMAYIPDMGPVEITSIGFSDSLRWIFPDMPGIDSLVIPMGTDSLFQAW